MERGCSVRMDERRHDQNLKKLRKHTQKLRKHTQKLLHNVHRHGSRKLRRTKSDYFHLQFSVMDTVCVCCAVGTESLNILHVKFMLQVANFTSLLHILTALQQQPLSLHQNVIPSSNYCGMFHPAPPLIRLWDNGEQSLLHNGVALEIMEQQQVQ